MVYQFRQLSNENIEAICDAVSEFMTTRGVAKHEIMKVMLTLEEALLDYQECFPEDSEVNLHMYTILGTIRAVIRVAGERRDPFEAESSSEWSLMGAIRAGEDAPRASWKYKSFFNEIVITARRERKLSSIAQIGIGFLCGALLGCAMLLLPEETARDIVTSYITPVTGAFTGLLCVMAAPMCFFAITLGIVRLGDISAFGYVAKKMLARFVLLALLLSFFGMLGASTQMLFVDSMFQLSGLSKLFEILVGFVPTNILSPLLNFNSVQIIIVGIMFGISFLALGQKAENAVELLDTLNSAAIVCNAVYLNRFIPYYVALTVMGIIGAHQIAIAPSFLRLSLDVLIGELFVLAFCAAAVRIRLKISLRTFCRKMAPPFMISLSSASFGAAFAENINSLLALGVEPDYAAMSYNVGGILFRPGECVILMSSSVYMAYLTGMEVSWFWILTAFVLSIILSVATPSIPGGTAVSLTILFSQLGFSSEALALIIPLSMVLEFPTVAVDAFCAKSQVLLLAGASGKTDLTRARELSR